jgi:DNA transformation protein
MEFSRLMNLGPASERALPEVGIHSIEQLREIGAVEAYLRLRARDPDRTSLNALYALEGALTGRHWRDFDDPYKQRLRDEVERFRQH